jgi:hypothetical protein
MTSGIPITHIDPQAVIAAYQSGKTLIEIGKEFGVHFTWVRNCLVKHDIPRRPSGARATVPDEQILKLSAEGLTLADISFITGIHLSSVHARLARLGVRK